ncbi:MAG: VPLPA-CTERM sorting domain-containing protein [Pseudomonadota bacterium]
MTLTIFVLVALAASASAISTATLKATGSNLGGVDTFLGLDFSIEFDDANGNGLLEASEVTSFSGVIAPFGDIGVLDVLVSIPNIPGTAVSGALVQLPSGFVPGSFTDNGRRWQFFGDDRTGTSSWMQSHASDWTYEITGLPDSSPAPVPLPATLPLILAGLGALRLARRAKA